MLRIRIENSRSRSGKHACRALAFVVSKEGLEIREPIALRTETVKPLYAKGFAYYLYTDLKDNELLVYVTLVKNLRNEVKGYIEVYTTDGTKVFRVKYVNGKIRCVFGNRRYWSVVEKVLMHLRIPYRRINLGTGVCFE
ncbi:MAG TPA: hypothetical protein EYP48_01805 [Ignisphaera sp.]|uniref:Uncharacterized protein n=1 Tax=Ignisphaera aggregans TaxID=334771 RepID=A0A832YZ67_9CREN|nr:hypothetical protein [Ignisphaera sp.]HIP57222.1 hypothetical protein [Ignisphaera aggregans]